MYDGTNPLAPEIKTVFPNNRCQGRSEETILRKSSSMTGCLVVSRRSSREGYHICVRAGLGETVPKARSVVSSVFFADFLRTVSNSTDLATPITRLKSCVGRVYGMQYLSRKWHMSCLN